MMLGLVPDQRTPQERLLDAIRTNGESMNYRYVPDEELQRLANDPEIMAAVTVLAEHGINGVLYAKLIAGMND